MCATNYPQFNAVSILSVNQVCIVLKNLSPDLRQTNGRKSRGNKTPSGELPSNPRSCEILLVRTPSMYLPLRNPSYALNRNAPALILLAEIHLGNSTVNVTRNEPVGLSPPM
jgi:hypothetical protein